MNVEKKNEKPLSELYRCFALGSLQKRDFEGKLFQYLLDNPDRYRIFERSKNRWNDFLSWLYPRIVRAIVLYRDIGSSFDAYITGLVFRASKEYQHREAEHTMTEYTCWHARAQEMAVCESEAEYLTNSHPATFRKSSSAERGISGRELVALPKGINPRQVLMLLLKSYFFASEEFVCRVCHTIGAEPDAVMKMIDELRELRRARETKIINLRDRVYCQYYRCLTYQKRMDSAQSGSEYHKKMEKRYQRARLRFARMRLRLRKMRVGAPNWMIAQVLGIPKGTVDSNLCAMKNHLAAFRENIT
ncbi:MAG: hypothetical protein FWD91_05445 [Treponema sp.]|nr:hypothetical protein [Treponema sp.]